MRSIQTSLALGWTLAPLAAAPLGAELRITEYMYSGAGGEFIEITNLGPSPVDLSGWSLDDDSAMAGVIDLTSLGILASGASAVVTEVPVADFEADWNLSGIPLVQNASTTGFGRNDAIFLFDSAGGIHDALTYGDQDFPGSIRTLNSSGNGCLQTLGSNDIFSWVLSSPGDIHGSFVSSTGDTGSPGSYTSPDCIPSFDASLSEIRIAQPGNDVDEYFELQGSGSLAGLYYIVLDGGGQIEHITDLSSTSFNAQGFLVAAESTFSLGSPELITDLNFEESGAHTHLLVSSLSASLGQDLDLDDDGFLDVLPWTSLVDGLGLDGGGAGGNPYAAGLGPDGGSIASLAILCPGGWRIGNADIAAGEDSPGLVNNCPPPTFDALLSEIRTDNDGPDVNEYFELSGSGSLTDVWYLVIGGNSSDPSGLVEAAIDLSGLGIGPSGIFVAAESTFDLGVQDAVIDLDFENDDNVTHLLVREFNAALGQDLDLDNDGILDLQPWFSVLDSVAIVDDTDFAAAGHLYSNTLLGPVELGAPAHIVRCPSGPWRVGNADSTDVDSPGLTNSCGGLGIRYCNANPNSSGLAARMSASGSTSVSMNQFTLECFDMPTVSPTSIFNFFVIGSTNAFVPFAVNQGNLCVGGLIGRYVGPGQITNAGMTGSATVTIDLGSLPPPLTGGIGSGQTWFFQNFYRDVNPTTTANLSDGLAVTFTP